MPVFMQRLNYEDLITQIIDDLTESSNIKFSQMQDKLIATIACQGSIRAGDIIERIQAQKIIDDLMKCKLPYSCPHGRPIIWELSKQKLADKFERN